VLEPREGACNICGMDLERVRLVLVYTCPVHAVIEQSKPGKCNICSRDLLQKTAALTFTCAGNRELSHLEPGKCADGSAMVPRYTQRPHGDHNPKHGGVFFMAPDNWHHLEGVYPAPGRFRVYVYDDFSKPLGREQARKVRGRVVTKEAFDPKTGTTRELASTPLVLARNGAFLEARIEQLALPAKLTAKITFSPDNKESRFDFAFPAYSRDVPPADQTTSASFTAPVGPVAPAAPLAPAAPVASVVPSSLLTDLKAQRADIDSLLQTGSVGGVYVPALRAKDLALEIQAAQSPASQDAMEASVKQIVLSAYQLDNYGDLGDAEKAREAFRGMAVAIAQLESLISEPTK
jgi:Heavy metal binding domain